MAKTAVVKKKVQEVVLSNVDQLFEENAGAGLATAPRDNVVPLIKIIQDQTKADVKKFSMMLEAKPGIYTIMFLTKSTMGIKV